MAQAIDTLIIGGGQAGLATSYHLRERGCEHIVLEQAPQAGSAWRNGRWDSFTLVTPNWSFRLPGADYGAAAPDDFMPRDEIVASFEDYVRRFDLPVRYGVRVTAVGHDGTAGGYRVITEDAEFEARNVVMATGPFQKPRIPRSSSDLPRRITQLHSGEYRRPDSIPDGAVLVVGSAQSGCQIADELYRSGRRVYLCTGGAGRVPRRYRGTDIVKWMDLMGLFDMTPDDLPSPKAKFAPNPHVTGAGGGRDLNLHRFARDGVVLLGHLQSADDDSILLRPDLHDNLAKADRFESDLAGAVDAYVAKRGLEAPEETLPRLDDGYRAEEVREVRLESAGITTVIWAIGYGFDFGLVKLPIFDDDGYPLQDRGVTRYPGLYFMGLPWMYKRRSALLLGVGEDAAFVASAILGEEHA
jgi:putative flavoprotein involved in K+ transport